MKYFAFFLLPVFQFLAFQSAKSQITLDYEDDNLAFGYLSCIDISHTESKYLLLYPETNSFRLFNMDFSPFTDEISVPVSGNMTDGYTVMYVTRNLFDCDDEDIEYVYSKPVGTNPQPIFYILRLDGTILLQEDNARGPYGFGGSNGGSFTRRPIKSTSDGVKLFLDILNSNGLGIKIYNLCGELPGSYENMPDLGAEVRVFPNPTNGEITFDYSSFTNQVGLKLIISDGSGKAINNETVTLDNHFVLNTSRLSSGTYYYTLTDLQKIVQRGKFVVQ